MAKIFKYELGDQVKDKYSEFKGMVMCRTQYLTGCIQYNIYDGKLDKDGLTTEQLILDEPRIVKQRTVKKISKKSGIGGPQIRGRHV